MALFSREPAVSTDEKKIDELLNRAVEKVIPKDLAQKKLLSGDKLRIYFGVDPTGPKLHLGHAVPLRKLKAFADAGHHVIFVVGSFTAMIGDPSGRDMMREPLTSAQVEENFQTYKRQAQKVLDLSGVEVRYNHEWLSPLTFANIVDLAGTFTVQQFLQRDMFQKRIQEGKPIGLHEFLYPLMVGYDSLVLDVDCELGGSDQEFNMLAGRHLQQTFGKREKFILTTRLIEGIDGRKMSKTYNNCIYLEDEPADMYGKIMSIKDELLRTYFECATLLSVEEIETILGIHPKDAKMRLAREIVTLYHGAPAAREAEDSWTAAFSDGAAPSDAPEITVAKGVPLREALKGVVESTSELRRLVSAGAISEVGGAACTSIDALIEKDMTLRIGKHRFLKINVH